MQYGSCHSLHLLLCAANICGFHQKLVMLYPDMLTSVVCMSFDLKIELNFSTVFEIKGSILFLTVLVKGIWYPD